MPYNPETPGPGSYDNKKSYGKSRKSSTFKQRAKIWNPGKGVPGPGYYKIEPTRASTALNVPLLKNHRKSSESPLRSQELYKGIYLMN